MNTDIEVGLSDEDRQIQETAHKFAAEVLRPAGVELDRMAEPADVIAGDSPLWACFKQHQELGFGALFFDEEMDPFTKARIGAIVNEELAWGD